MNRRKKTRGDIPVVNPLREPVQPSDDLKTVIAKAREEADWFPEDGKTWRLLRRMADELEKHLPPTLGR